MISLKTLYLGGIRTQVLSKMRYPLRHAARANKNIVYVRVAMHDGVSRSTCKKSNSLKRNL
jgi:hypothetical protein